MRGTIMARRLHIAISLAAALALAGCGEAATPTSITASGSDRLPSSSMRDWVSYSDHVAVFSVTAEQEIAPTPEEIAIGEGLVGRRVTIEIERVLWSAPKAPVLPTTFDTTTYGWALVEGAKVELVPDDGPRLTVGGRYLAPLVLFEDAERSEWATMTSSSELPLDGSRIAGGDWDSTMKDMLTGRSVDETAAIVKRQPPDPLAAKNRALRPVDRLGAVTQELAG
jgi:hypothetical protein